MHPVGLYNIEATFWGYLPAGVLLVQPPAFLISVLGQDLLWLYTACYIKQSSLQRASYFCHQLCLLVKSPPDIVFSTWKMARRFEDHISSL